MNFVSDFDADHNEIRDVGDRWAGWAIAHPGFGRSVNPISNYLLAHPALGSFLRHWQIIERIRVFKATEETELKRSCIFDYL